MTERSALGISDFLLLSLSLQQGGKSSQHGGGWEFGGLGMTDVTRALGVRPLGSRTLCGWTEGHSKRRSRAFISIAR